MPDSWLYSEDFLGHIFDNLVRTILWRKYTIFLCPFSTLHKWFLASNLTLNLVKKQSCDTILRYITRLLWVLRENDSIVVPTVLWYFCYNLAKNIKVCLSRPKFSQDGVWQQSCDSYSNWNLAKKRPSVTSKPYNNSEIFEKIRIPPWFSKFPNGFFLAIFWNFPS